MAQRRAIEKKFFASIRGDGGCERADVICFFPDLEETEGGVLCKEKNVKCG